MFALAMAVVGRCAISTFCPTDAELKAALYTRVDQDIADYVVDAQRKNPNESILAHPVPIRSVRNVHCGSPSPSEPKSINCNFTLDRGYSVDFETAKLTHRDGEWVIIESLTVSRRTAKGKR